MKKTFLHSNASYAAGAETSFVVEMSKKLSYAQ